jgi:hypothetical protein
MAHREVCAAPPSAPGAAPLPVLPALLAGTPDAPAPAAVPGPLPGALDVGLDPPGFAESRVLVLPVGLALGAGSDPVEDTSSSSSSGRPRTSPPSPSPELPTHSCSARTRTCGVATGDEGNGMGGWGGGEEGTGWEGRGVVSRGRERWVQQGKREEAIQIQKNMSMSMWRDATDGGGGERGKGNNHATYRQHRALEGDVGCASTAGAVCHSVRQARTQNMAHNGTVLHSDGTTGAVATIHSPQQL